MLLKCWICDEAKIKEMKELNQHIDENGKLISVKTINIETDDYIKDKTKYYHTECFRQFKLSKGKMSENEVENMISQYKVEQHKIQQNKIMESKFFEYIKNHYQVALQYHFCNRIKNITQGKDEKVYGAISYEELLEMYRMMENYLAKAIIGKKFDNTSQRMNYELAIIISKYEDYRNYKNKLAEKNHIVVDINKKLESSQKFSDVKEKVRKEDNDNFYVADILDELI